MAPEGFIIYKVRQLFENIYLLQERRFSTQIANI